MEVKIYIPTYAQSPDVQSIVLGGGCLGATAQILSVTRELGNAPQPNLDEWGQVKDTLVIQYKITGGNDGVGTAVTTAKWD